MSKKNNRSFNSNIRESDAQIVKQQSEINDLRESLDILSRELQRTQWIELTAQQGSEDFAVTDRKTIAKWAQIYFIKNPLIGLAVTLKTTFIFGSGATVKAENPLIQEVVVDDFWKDPDNLAELTSLSAQQLKSNTLQLDGNIFLTFFVNMSTGHVKVSSIPADEIDEIITHPDNRRKPLWYKRTYTEQKFDYENGAYDSGKSVTKYYRDWRNTDPNDKVYDPTDKSKIAVDSAGQEILVFHLKVNCTDKQKFGFSETYRAHDWAKAYTDYLSDLASIWKTLAIFAVERKLKGRTKNQVAAAAKQMRSYTDGSAEQNRKPAAGSARVSNEFDEWTPIKTSGVTMSADDGRRLLLMVCAAMGIFEHYFGDGSNSNLASTTAMELPMLKMFKARQALFEDMYRQIFKFVIEQSAKASSGKLNGYAEWDGESGKLILNDYDNPDPQTGDTEISQDVSIDFPPIVERDVVELVGALKTALTLDGMPQSDTPLITAKEASRLLLTYLEVDGADEILEELYPANGAGSEEVEPVPGEDPNQQSPKTGLNPDELLTPRESAIIKMLGEVRETMKAVKENADSKPS